MKNEKLEHIKNITSSIEEVSQAKNKVEIFEKIETLLKDLSDSDFATLFIFDKDTYMLSIINEQMLELSMLEVEGCIGKVFLTKNSAIYNHLASDKDYVQAYDNPLNHRLRAQMLMPVLDNGELVGIVRVSCAIGSDKKSYTKADLDALISIESYLVKIIKTIQLDQPLPSFDESSKNIQNKMEEIEVENKVTTKVENQDDILLFLSNTVHDIRTPANSLYGFLELLEEQIEDERLKEFVTNAKESASFINTLITIILDSAKDKYTSTNNIKSETITTVKFLSEIANTFAARMLEKKINYFIYLSPEIPREIKIDTLKLKRVLANLIGNAYKFTPNKQQIDLQVLWDDSSHSINFSVKDTGIGIDKSDQEKLFKSFSQAQNDTHENYGGTGLGLALSAEYVAALGGELKVNSQIDMGSEFYFNIPVEIIDSTRSYEEFYNLDKKVVILTDYLDAKYPKFIRKYLIDLGMPKEKISITDRFENDSTHVICFEEKITEEILEAGKRKKFELLLIEQKLFSLLNNKKINDIKVTSENTYNGEALYSTIFSGKKVKVLLIDDNKMNIRLLESMLATEFVEIHSCFDGDCGLKMLNSAVANGEKFDVVYLDKHMPGISGSELLSEFRAMESLSQINPIYAVSISGDPDIDESEKKLFNAFVNKPFSKKEVREVIHRVKNN